MNSNGRHNRKIQINPRVSPKIYKRIEDEAKRKDTSVNMIASHKLEDYYSKRIFKEKNNLSMLKNILKMMFDSNTPEKMEEYTDLASQFVLSEWKLQVKNPNLDEFHKRVTEWHQLNHIDVSMFEEDRQHRKYVVRHELGLRWSEFQCKLYSKMLQKIKQTVICTDFDDLSFTIEIAKSE